MQFLPQGATVPMVFITGNKVSDTVGKSLMMAQCERIGHMLNGAIKLAGQGYKVMLKFDEPFDGTSPEERRALVAAIIIYVGMKPNLYASIATHERSLIDLVTGLEAKPVGGTITAPSENPMSKYASALATVRNVHYSDYEKHDGGAVNRNALKIAAQMGMPEKRFSRSPVKFSKKQGLLATEEIEVIGDNSRVRFVPLRKKSWITPKSEIVDIKPFELTLCEPSAYPSATKGEQMISKICKVSILVGALAFVTTAQAQISPNKAREMYLSAEGSEVSVPF